MTTPTPRTTSPSTPADDEPTTETRHPAPHGLGLSAAQVAGSALAAVSGAFLASWLGVTGTLVGVAVGSVVGTVGSASYTYSLRRGHALVARPAVREGEQAGGPVAARPDAAPAPVPAPRRREPLALPWRRLGVATVVAALIGLGGLTLLETVTGRPVASVAGRSTDTGTTLGSVLGQSGGSGSTSDGPASDTDQDGAGSGSGGTDGDGSGQPTDTSEDEPTDVPTDEPDPTTPPDPTPDPSPTDPTPTPTPGTPVTP